ncbi:MAG: bifunctional diaminohydroxyphosphoribosylaminopyrimidine deaminase/5-amino-6-(5-phosphoribosylamino)uracil reductase RibD [Anaerovoracaceae bacterium]
MTDEKYMEMALQLARKGIGSVSPNPLVGAVIVKDGKVIGKGYHTKAGQPHAERVALAQCSTSPQGATLYVNLEPCCHQGRTPPCTDAIIESGIARVVIGSEDPNPKVCGKGTNLLKEWGISVTEGILESECQTLNEVFFHYARLGTPYVVMKYAMTMDGKIATRTGASRWISGKESRLFVHEMRNRLSGIMVGVGTVLADDPLLTCRIEGGRNPVRIICDTNLRTPLTAKVVETAGDISTIIATSVEDVQRHLPYSRAGCKILTVPKAGEHTDLNALMKRLGEMEIDSILLEGGSEMHWSALESGIVQKVQCVIAPQVFGGRTAKAPVGGMGVDIPDHAYQLAATKISELGRDYLLESEVVYPCSQE